MPGARVSLQKNAARQDDANRDFGISLAFLVAFRRSEAREIRLVLMGLILLHWNNE